MKHVPIIMYCSVCSDVYYTWAHAHARTHVSVSP